MEMEILIPKEVIQMLMRQRSSAGSTITEGQRESDPVLLMHGQEAEGLALSDQQLIPLPRPMRCEALKATPPDSSKKFNLTTSSFRHTTFRNVHLRPVIMGNCVGKGKIVSNSNSFTNLQVVDGNVQKNSNKRSSPNTARNTASKSIYNSVYNDSSYLVPYANQKVAEQEEISRNENYLLQQANLSTSSSPIKPQTSFRSRAPESGTGSLESKQSHGSSLERTTLERQMTDQKMEQLLRRNHVRTGGSHSETNRGHSRTSSHGAIGFNRDRSDSKRSSLVHADFIRKGSWALKETKVQRNDSGRSDLITQRSLTDKDSGNYEYSDESGRKNTLFQSSIPEPVTPQPLKRSDSCTNELNPVLRNKNIQLRRNAVSDGHYLKFYNGDDETESESETDQSEEEEQANQECACIIKWKKGVLLGKGSFGKILNLELTFIKSLDLEQVYNALTDKGEIVAVKQIQLDTENWSQAEQDYRIIQREVNLLKTLQHPNIVKFLDCGLDISEYTINILMEHISGGTISSLLKKFGVFDEEIFRRYTSQIIDSVIYLHHNNVIHRDIKGSNIMVANNGCVKLIDFGTAKKTTEDLVTPLSAIKLNYCIKGTPYWMAPEVVQMTGEPTCKADIWSVGCTVIEMATGSPPYFHMPAMSAMFTIGSNEKPSPKLPERFSEEAKEFVALCLTKDMRARPTSNELGEHKFMLKEYIHSYTDNRKFYI